MAIEDAAMPDASIIEEFHFSEGALGWLQANHQNMEDMEQKEKEEQEKEDKKKDEKEEVDLGERDLQD